MTITAIQARRAVFEFLTPVHVEVEDGMVVSVTVIDDTPVENATYVDGDPKYMHAAIKAANDGQAWPSWQIGN